MEVERLIMQPYKLFMPLMLKLFLFCFSYTCLSQVFNQAAFQAQSDQELTDAVGDFMDCCIVIPPTEIQDESMLTSLIPFQKKLLQERLRPSDPKLRLEVKPRKRKDTVHTLQHMLNISL